MCVSKRDISIISVVEKLSSRTLSEDARIVKKKRKGIIMIIIIIIEEEEIYDVARIVSSLDG